MRKLALGLVGLLVAAAIAAGALVGYVRGKAEAPGTSTAPVEVKIPKGASRTEVGKILASSGLFHDPLVLRAYLRLERPPAPKAGRHQIPAGASLAEIYAKLAENPLPDDVPITIVEGQRIADVDRALTAAGWIAAGAYVEAASHPERYTIAFSPKPTSLEGFLYPETYHVPNAKPLDVGGLIQRQLDMFHERFARPEADKIAASKRSLAELVVMASMLEREEPTPALRPKVAGVLYKRLDAKTPLGVDATSRYTLVDWNDRAAFLKQLRDPADPYNTRLKVGLPPTAIGAPAVESLRAALAPEESPHWYYLHDQDRQIHFARTAAEHEENRRKYNVW